MILLEYKPQCSCCELIVDKVVPDPRDSLQEYRFSVCIPCEYEITERVSYEPQERKDYGSVSHGF